jgi:monofunctional biosynthetic peptidoglycan transglycosylase
MGKGILFILLVTGLHVLMLRFVNPPFTLRTACQWLSSGGEKGDLGLRGRWCELKRISPSLRKAVLAGEDQRFLRHHGFDFVELYDAVNDMIQAKGTRGASTITMQTARTVFLWPARSWVRKALEAYYTVLIELFWTKARILEMYLNTVEWGTEIYGVEAASRRYFSAPCSGLTPAQAALLAAILPNPHAWSAMDPNPHVRERQRNILKDMNKMPLLSWGKRGPHGNPEA